MLSSACALAAAQGLESDDQLMLKARAAYDAPFARNLTAFDCNVQFDWKEYFAEILGTIPPPVATMAERLQAVTHRVSVDHSHALASSIPKQPDLQASQQDTQLDNALIAMISAGLNAWLPSSTNVMLPVGKTQYEFEKLQSGFKLTMKGDNIAGTLLLGPDLRVTSGVMQRPQPMRFSTDFESGPQGFVLASIQTGRTTDATVGGEASFAYTYQSVDGLQLPETVTMITPATTGKWRYRLTDCKVVKFVKVQTLPGP